MSALGSKLWRSQLGGLMFHCPGCGYDHVVHEAGQGWSGPTWSFNGNGDKPTFSPSVLVTTGRAVDSSFVKEEGDPPEVCHSFIIDGRIQFLGDCDHELASQTVEIPDWRAS